nr:NADH dehydrogenase subunit 2 [Artemidia motanka]
MAVVWWIQGVVWCLCCSVCTAVCCVGCVGVCMMGSASSMYGVVLLHTTCSVLCYSILVHGTDAEGVVVVWCGLSILLDMTCMCSAIPVVTLATHDIAMFLCVVFKQYALPVSVIAIAVYTSGSFFSIMCILVVGYVGWVLWLGWCSFFFFFFFFFCVLCLVVCCFVVVGECTSYTFFVVCGSVVGYIILHLSIACVIHSTVAMVQCAVGVLVCVLWVCISCRVHPATPIHSSNHRDAYGVCLLVVCCLVWLGLVVFWYGASKVVLTLDASVTPSSFFFFFVALCYAMWVYRVLVLFGCVATFGYSRVFANYRNIVGVCVVCGCFFFF